MSAEKIISQWRKKEFKPVYWLEGDEPYFMDKLVQYAEKKILSEAEASFNLTILYGRDIDMPALISACKKYPMFGDRQVIIVKEAQHLKNIEVLEGYFMNPQPTTLLLMVYKDKKFDGRTKFARSIKKYGEHFSSKKLYDSELPSWIASLLKDKGRTISPHALALLVDHIGNDLSRIENEIQKMELNLPDNHLSITTEDIENNIGISKDFNAFELQKAVAYKDLPKAIRIIQYFESNPKAAPLQMIIPALYNFFCKVAVAHSVAGKDERAVASALGVNFYFVKDYMAAVKNFSASKVEQVLLQLHNYNLKSIGVGDSGTPAYSLLKELTIKIVY